MLGFGIYVYRKPLKPSSGPIEQESVLASWITSFGGLKWLDELVENGTATMEGGGYPFLYTAAAKDILPKLRGGPPRHDGPMVIGEDYVLPGGWPRDVKINRAMISSCMPEEELVIEAWDLS